ncbi:MAG TPA: disulfide bond formation protein B [Candidatus Paceibacterota bacterium]|jgi:disulfide bond formation protein DsbB|nr:disulfide bond formation protein B [Candidatus Paceibacterota bacterium]
MTPFVTNITNLLSLGTIAAEIFGIFLILLLATPLGERGWGKRTRDFLGEYALTLAFLMTLAAAGSSLFYSDVAGFAPCLLCWWQRIFLYPQLILLLIAVIKRDDAVRKYCLALSGIGVLISIYHTYLQFGGNDLVPCSATGVSCNHVYFVTYGYITIPTMALTAFAVIFLLMLIPRPSED